MNKINLFFISVLLIMLSCNTNTNTVTDIDGNIYRTVKIGTQVWMAENLKVKHYQNGDLIENVTSDSDWIKLSTGAWCIYSNDTIYGKMYGNLYNWYAVNDARKLAPKGWHIATDEEWTTLTNYLGGKIKAGGKLKEAGTTHWETPNTGATNKVMFCALPGGYRYNNGWFSDGGYYGYWWSSTNINTKYAWSRYLIFGNSLMNRENNMKLDGYSVRCVKD